MDTARFNQNMIGFLASRHSMLVDVGNDIYLPGTILIYGLKSLLPNERYFSEYCRAEGIRNHFNDSGAGRIQASRLASMLTGICTYR